MTSSLVGSEMCIRDRGLSDWFRIPLKGREDWPARLYEKGYNEVFFHGMPCLLYTSDAADDM
eukprot:9329115-Prorocentrum_lima.AAC.1